MRHAFAVPEVAAASARMAREAGPVGAVGARRTAAALWLLALALGLSACTSVVRVQPLATARTDMPAYNLSGSSLQVLAREASNLCPAGLQLLRQSQSGTRLVQVDSRWHQAWLNAGAVLDPPQAQAQMMVLCHAADAAPVAMAISATTPASASMPAPAPQPQPQPPKATLAPADRPVTLVKAQAAEIDELDLAAQGGRSK